MIFGRSPNLILAAFTAVFNVLVLTDVVMLTVEAVGGINIAAAAVIALIANTDAGSPNNSKLPLSTPHNPEGNHS